MHFAFTLAGIRAAPTNLREEFVRQLWVGIQVVTSRVRRRAPRPDQVMGVSPPLVRRAEQIPPRIMQPEAERQGVEVA